MPKSPAAPKPFSGWPAEALKWFRDLEANNSRDWFQSHRGVYDESVRGPLESLLAEVAQEFGDGKVTRPNRDIRFSADKSPYKVSIYAIVNRPEDAGGWYVQLDKEGLFVGGGMYAPERPALTAIRKAIDDDRSGRELEGIVGQLAGQGLSMMEHETLKTAPRGYSADHPRVELLRMKHIAAGTKHEPQPWLHTPKAKEHVVFGWRAVTPLLDWLNRAIRT